MTIKYTTKTGKKKEIKIDPECEAITVETNDGDFAQVYIKDSNRKQQTRTVLSRYNCDQVAFLGTECKLRRKTYRGAFRD